MTFCLQTTLNPEAQLLLDALRVAQLNQGDMFALEPTPWVVGTVLELNSDTEDDEVVVNYEPQSPIEEDEKQSPIEEDVILKDDWNPNKSIDQSDSSFQPLSESYTVTLNTEVVQPQEEQDPLVMLMASITLLVAGFLILCALMAFAWYCCGVKKDNVGKQSQKIQKKRDDHKQAYLAKDDEN